MFSPENQERLRRIKLLALDVDGVMTDGSIQWFEGQGWTRKFHVSDGYGMKRLMDAGIPVAVISAGQSRDLKERIQLLKIPHAYLGSEDKLSQLEDLLKVTGLAAQEVAYCGDDLFDIPVLERVGFAATVPHATEPVKRAVHYVTRREGGQGAVRELTDAIREIQGLD